MAPITINVVTSPDFTTPMHAANARPRSGRRYHENINVNDSTPAHRPHTRDIQHSHRLTYFSAPHHPHHTKSNTYTLLPHLRPPHPHLSNQYYPASSSPSLNLPYYSILPPLLIQQCPRALVYRGSGLRRSGRRHGRRQMSLRRLRRRGRIDGQRIVPLRM